jgi:hypothetical protein
MSKPSICGSRSGCDVGSGIHTSCELHTGHEAEDEAPWSMTVS